MALLRIDWNPGDRKVREFGLILVALSITLVRWRFGSKAAAVFSTLGLLAAIAPSTAGLAIYKVWMGFSFVVGTVLSPILLGVVYYLVLTPLALAMRLSGRDALRLKRPKTDTYWTPFSMPAEKSDYERLF